MHLFREANAHLYLYVTYIPGIDCLSFQAQPEGISVVGLEK
jgi:hypothetical protein